MSYFMKYLTSAPIMATVALVNSTICSRACSMAPIFMRLPKQEDKGEQPDLI